MVPTGFFKDPDIMNLKNKEAQLLLIGRILFADDEGREVAYAPLLARELDASAESIEQGLQDLAANDLIVLYQVGRHRYYGLTKWWQWQNIPPSKRVPSKNPAPPDPLQPSASEGCSESLQERSENLQGRSESLQECSKTLQGRSEMAAQYRVVEERLEEESGGEEGEKQQLPPNVVTFRTSHTTGGGTEEETPEKTPVSESTQQLARILKLSPSEGLQRLIEDYRDDPHLSLLGEADAAREWIDDPKRNRKHQQMSLAFFRRWLRREQEEALNRQKQREQQSATGTTGPGKGTAAPPARNSLMNLAAQYHQQTTHQGSTEKEIQHG